MVPPEQGEAGQQPSGLLGVRARRFTSAKTILASASWDKTVRLWNVGQARPRPLGRPLGHTGEVYEVAFAPDGRTLATGSLDKTVRLWDVANPNRPRLLTRLS